MSRSFSCLESPSRSRLARRSTQTSRNSPKKLDSPTQQQVSQTAQQLAKRGLRIGRTSVGKGVFATKRIVDGTCIGEIQGLVIADDMYVSRYSFDLFDGKQLEPAAPFRFVNHSCNPNCAFESFEFRVMDTKEPSQRLLLFAIGDITIGEELTIDYNWPACFAIPCNCRSSDCRGWIVAPNELALLQNDSD